MWCCYIIFYNQYSTSLEITKLGFSMMAPLPIWQVILYTLNENLFLTVWFHKMMSSMACPTLLYVIISFETISKIKFVFVMQFKLLNSTRMPSRHNCSDTRTDNWTSGEECQSEVDVYKRQLFGLPNNIPNDVLWHWKSFLYAYTLKLYFDYTVWWKWRYLIVC